ncbi:MAG TPA: hypothetical protein VGE45_01090 [Chloroflexia bacterium]|jgi:hypothetical protein
MKPGDKVNIYEDPLEREHLEGEATLVRKGEDYGVYDGVIVERWTVRFPGDDDTYERLIVNPDID